PLRAAGRLRDLIIDLPRGEVVNPTATSVRCTEVQLISESHPGCPDASQIGTVTLTTVPTFEPTTITSSLYNMVPPKGNASSFAFNALGLGIFIPIIGSVRSDGDYGLKGTTANILARPFNPILGVQAQFWGSPSGAAHDQSRGACANAVPPGAFCPVEATDTA